VESESEGEVDVCDNEADMFLPGSGNVAFGSAYDGWAFTLDQFAAM
jgi:hypothetical protein